MLRWINSLVLLGLLAGWQVVQAAAPDQMKRVVASDEAVRTQVIAELRREGPTVLPSLFEMRDNLLTLQTAARNTGKDETAVAEQLARVERAIDEVSAQRYACHSRLYWYTDLEAAKAVAAKEKKPILSLRMLGKLNEDFSCANSRFFRTTLYANADVSKLLRERFVLHWKSVRPVPRVTIDFGDGRKLERTLTGNSIHYVLASDGLIVDALPGLYGPTAFIEKLTMALNTTEQVAVPDQPTRENLIVNYHQEMLRRLDVAWANDFQTATGLLNQPATPADAAAVLKAASQPAQPQQVAQAEPPPAAKAVRVAVPKMLVERPLVRAAVPTDPVVVVDERLWQIISELHAKEAKLDAASLKLIRSENPTAARAARLAINKGKVEDPVLRMVRSLEGSIAVDTVRNEYQLHRQIHQWLATPDRPEVEAFNERVYAQLFLTPSSDPWLGLAPADTYTALPNAGVAANK